MVPVRGGIGGFSARIEVVEETEGIVPFQRYAFVGEPEGGGGDVGVDEGGEEERVEFVDVQGEVGEAGELDQVRIRLIICSAVIPVQPYLERNTSIPHLLAQPTRDFARRHRETLGESARRFEFKAK